MTDLTIEADQFAMTLQQIFDNLKNGVVTNMPEALEKALERGEESWRQHAEAVLSSSYSRGGWGKLKDQTFYKRGPRAGQVKSTTWYGKTYKTGKYARSIRHQVLSSGNVAEGEIGSPTVPGLAHLLEKGHAQVGGGFVSGRPHIEPAAEDAFLVFENELEVVIDNAIADA